MIENISSRFLRTARDRQLQRAGSCSHAEHAAESSVTWVPGLPVGFRLPARRRPNGPAV